MSGTVLDSPVQAALSRLRAVVDELLDLPHDALTDADEIELAGAVETAKRRLAPVDHAVINQLQTRSIAFSHGCRTTTMFVSQLLRISRAEAAARVKAAELLGARRTITGEPLAPQFPMVAAAQACGQLSDRHAAVITHAVTTLPDEVAERAGDWLEATLVEHGRQLDPVLLDRHARQLCYALDQDGQDDKDRSREKNRGLTLRRRVDGSARLEGELSAECAEHLHTALDALTKPTPTTPAGPDPRNASQRRHDAFLELLKLLERAEQLPNAGGITTTVLLTMDADAWVTATGTATTGHGYTMSAQTAKRWAGGDTRLVLTLLSTTKAITAYSTAHRIFTESQRLAIISRDRGCTFPDCDAGPQWCEVNHVPEWQHTHRTCVDAGALACCGDHRQHQAMGWAATMLDGVPHWVPPTWLDPQQKPRRNTRHDLLDPEQPQ